MIAHQEIMKMRGQVVVLNDNDPSDMDETVGKYVTYIGNIDIIDVQGATFSLQLLMRI